MLLKWELFKIQNKFYIYIFLVLGPEKMLAVLKEILEKVDKLDL